MTSLMGETHLEFLAFLYNRWDLVLSAEGTGKSGREGEEKAGTTLKYLKGPTRKPEGLFIRELKRGNLG